MFDYDIDEDLKKTLRKLKKKDHVLVKNFKKKFMEIIQNDKESINRYKNLKSPKNSYKRIHLTDNYVLLFQVNTEDNLILFIEITHRDYVYGN